MPRIAHFCTAILMMAAPATLAAAQDNPERTAEADGKGQAADISAYGADGKGEADSAPALARAIAAAGVGGEVVIPAGRYHLSRNPLRGVAGSITIRSSAQAIFAGPGAAGVNGFNHTLTNGYNTSAGSWQVWRDLPAPQAGADTTQGWAQELIGPARGAMSQVLGYMGADSNGNTADGNVQEVLNLVQNVHAADRIGTGIYKPFEIDLNVDVSAPGAVTSANGAGLIGMLLTGGGAGGPHQGSGMQGVLLQRTTGAWGKALVVQNAAKGLEVNASRIPIDIQTTYYGAVGDPACPRDSNPQGCTVGAGIVFSNAPAFAGTVFAAGQLANGNDTVTLRRASDKAPAGTLLRLRNAADDADLASIDAQGHLTSTLVQITGTALAALPRCGGTSAGSIAFVTDLAEPVTRWRQEVTRGGGHESAFVACDGTAWRAH
ncbi:MULTISPECIES: hypothetical protein [Novosphingobium]|uniref:hypothetical protein n=1 Tax=Novosphingobium TaxID=165696 RepID=UPI0022F2A0F9|nr:hypothetical protein [Novosphingobium resinovorum]GLK44136.1 hypothetical protein GCM10017612_20560 [Novosphingobium resinovorum]